VQLELLAHGGEHPQLHVTSTRAALDALRALGILEADDAVRLVETYELCERARNYRYLLTGTSGDSLPVDGEEATHLARMLGYSHRPQQTLRDEYRRVTRRARDVVERVFYGRPA
jgi:glutamate-ammonia-ligase adenylyltransferase